MRGSVSQAWEACKVVLGFSPHERVEAERAHHGLLRVHELKLMTTLLALLTLMSPLAAQTVELRQTSVPVGIVNQTTSVPLNSVQVTQTAPNTSSGYTWAYWTLNAVRWEDASGAAENPANFIATGAVDAVAIYYPTTEDTDSDGLPDWWEWRYWGNLAQTATTDPDSDAFNNAEEYLRGYHPRLHNLHEHGGISRRRSPNFIVIQDTATYARLRESSTPAGVFQQERVVVKGVPITIYTPPDSFNGWRFTGWLKDGLRWDQPTDWQPITFTPTQDTDLVARYTLETEDSDTDGLLDWKELRWFESLQYTNTSDPDADGFTIAEEETRGFSSLAHNELAHGGISRRRGPTLYVDTTGRLMFRQTSEPATILEQTEYFPAGTVVTLPDKTNHTFANYKFAWWDINGVRQEDASGVALGGLTLPLTVPITATARYFDPTVDTDTDGILDWSEWYHYGTLANNATSDTDGDGFTYAEELVRNQSPRAFDTLAHGGVSRRRSPTFFVDTTGRFFLRQTSDPATILEQTDYFTPGTLVTVPDKNNHTFADYKFSWWDRNGVRQADASGVALTGMSFALIENTTMEANYIDPTVDADSDGILDWHEWTYYGTLTNGPTSDTDTDGFTYAEEITRNQSPRVADVLEHGGISRRRGTTITIDPNITPTAPVVGALAARNISTTTATISALVNPMSAATTANFEFGLTTSYGFSVASESILNGFIADSMSAYLFNLQPATTYYYRVIATNSVGTTTSTAGSFTTLPGLTAYQQWRQIYGISVDAGDNDGDGVKNLVEYAFGGNPLINGDSWRVPTIELIGGRLCLRVTEPFSVAGSIIYGAEWTQNFGTWTPITDSGSGTFHEFLTPTNLIGCEKVFVRWVIQAP